VTGEGFSGTLWNRVLLKLSGEAFAGGEALGIDPVMVATIARQLARIRERLVDETRRALRAELSASSDLDDVLQLIGSKLEASLSREP